MSYLPSSFTSAFTTFRNATNVGSLAWEVVIFITSCIKRTSDGEQYLSIRYCEALDLISLAPNWEGSLGQLFWEVFPEFDDSTASSESCQFWAAVRDFDPSVYAQAMIEGRNADGYHVVVMPSGLNNANPVWGHEVFYSASYPEAQKFAQAHPDPISGYVAVFTTSDFPTL